MADSLASKAGRTRPPIVGRWPGPVLSSFVTANLESETNFLRPDIRVGRVVASVGDPPLEMPLPFGRRDLQLVRSGSAAVLRVDAVRGSPGGDFTKKSGCRVAARRCPYRLTQSVGARRSRRSLLRVMITSPTLAWFPSANRTSRAGG
jgi:hypothetical protein